MHSGERSSQQSESAPPYSQTDFDARNQLLGRDEQIEYHRRQLRELQMEQPSTCERSLFGLPYLVQQHENLPDPNPFLRPIQGTTTHLQSHISNDFNNLQAQGDLYQKEYSSDAFSDLTRCSPISGFPPNQEPGYLQRQPSRNPLEASIPITSNDSETPSDQQIISQALAFFNQASSLPPHIPALRQAIAIPQTVPGGQAFARAWAPSLSAYRITQTKFLAFIDGINIVSTTNPPLKVLNLAGGIVRMVPCHWAAIAGLTIQATAQLGTAAVSKGRTDKYMKEANENFFAPRKLKVAIASRDVVGVVLRMPSDQPILAPLTRETMSMGMVERSLAVLREFAAELDFNVPPPAEQTTVLAKMSAKQIERQRKKNEKKTLEEREKAFEKEEKEQAKFLQKQ